MRAHLLVPLLLSGLGCSSPAASSGDGGVTDASGPPVSESGATMDGGAPAADAQMTAHDGARAGDAGGTDGGGAGGGGPTVGGCPLFPLAYPYNVDVSSAPLDP